MTLCLRIPKDLIFKLVTDTKRSGICCDKESPKTAKFCSACGGALEYKRDRMVVHDNWTSVFVHNPGVYADEDKASILGLECLNGTPYGCHKYVYFKLQQYKSEETKDDRVSEVRDEEGAVWEVESYPKNPFDPAELDLTMVVRHAELWMRDFEKHGIPRDQMRIVVV